MHNQLEVKGVDGAHIRTCLRAKICRPGLANIKKTAWVKVEKSGKTPLKMTALQVLPNGKVVEQQNQAFARTMFCEQIEREMLENNDIQEVTFCCLIREWSEAEDTAGIAALEIVFSAESEKLAVGWSIS